MRRGEIYRVKDCSVPQLVTFYNKLLLPDEDERAETIRQITKKSFRRRKHGKIKKNEGNSGKFDIPSDLNTDEQAESPESEATDKMSPTAPEKEEELVK